MALKLNVIIDVLRRVGSSVLILDSNGLDFHADALANWAACYDNDYSAPDLIYEKYFTFIYL